MSSIKISVITITFNSEKYLEQTIQSVVNQTYKNIEYIIIDGGSTDSTLNIIRKYDNRIKKWISEPDKGIADAMNKGIALSTGEYIYFLHSDDYLFSKNVIDDFVKEQDEFKADIFAHSIIFNKSLGKSVEILPRGYGVWLNLKNGFHHQGTFCRRNVFEKIGGFDVQFKIAMDYDFFLRAYNNNIPCTKGNSIIAIMRDVGISSKTDWPSLKKRLREERLVHIKNCKYWILFYPIYWLVYSVFKQIKTIWN